MTSINVDKKTTQMLHHWRRRLNHWLSKLRNVAKQILHIQAEATALQNDPPVLIWFTQKLFFNSCSFTRKCRVIFGCNHLDVTLSTLLKKWSWRTQLAFFSALWFLPNTLLGRWKIIFRKKYHLQQILTIFRNIKFFLLPQKTLNSGGKKMFYWNNFIWYAIFGIIAIFREF